MSSLPPSPSRGSAALRLSSPDPGFDMSNPDEVAAAFATFKRRMASMAEQIADTAQATSKRPITTKTLGRGIRKLVALFDNVSSILDEADRRTTGDPPAKDAQPRHLERLFRAYPLFLQLVPQFRAVAMVQGTNGINAVNAFLAELQEGANSARSDDVKRIKEEVYDRINMDYRPTMLLQKSTRENRGLQHDVCGGLLTPIQFDWNDTEVRAKIRGSKEGYIISSNYYLTCLYARGTIFNPRRIEMGFLRSTLLVQVYCVTFTSPSSADSIKESDDFDTEPPLKKHKSSPKATKSSVSSLLNMDGKVTGRSIAYAAVLLAFNLTEAVQWTESHNNFSFVGFYNFLVDYFEEERDPAGKRRVQDLLEWWNEQVFPQYVSAAADSDESRNMLLDQDDY